MLYNHCIWSLGICFLLFYMMIKRYRKKVSNIIFLPSLSLVSLCFWSFIVYILKSVIKGFCSYLNKFTNDIRKESFLGHLILCFNIKTPVLENITLCNYMTLLHWWEAFIEKSINWAKTEKQLILQNVSEKMLIFQILR